MKKKKKALKFKSLNVDAYVVFKTNIGMSAWYSIGSSLAESYRLKLYTIITSNLAPSLDEGLRTSLYSSLNESLEENRKLGQQK